MIPTITTPHPSPTRSYKQLAGSPNTSIRSRQALEITTGSEFNQIMTDSKTHSDTFKAAVIGDHTLAIQSSGFMLRILDVTCKLISNLATQEFLKIGTSIVLRATHSKSKMIVWEAKGPDGTLMKVSKSVLPTDLHQLFINQRIKDFLTDNGDLPFGLTLLKLEGFLDNGNVGDNFQFSIQEIEKRNTKVEEYNITNKAYKELDNSKILAPIAATINEASTALQIEFNADDHLLQSFTNCILSVQTIHQLLLLNLAGIKTGSSFNYLDFKNELIKLSKSAKTSQLTDETLGMIQTSSSPPTFTFTPDAECSRLNLHVRQAFRTLTENDNGILDIGELIISSLDLEYTSILTKERPAGLTTTQNCLLIKQELESIVTIIGYFLAPNGITIEDAIEVDVKHQAYRTIFEIFQTNEPQSGAAQQNTAVNPIVFSDLQQERLTTLKSNALENIKINIKRAKADIEMEKSRALSYGIAAPNCEGYFWNAVTAWLPVSYRVSAAGICGIQHRVYAIPKQSDQLLLLNAPHNTNPELVNKDTGPVNNGASAPTATKEGDVEFELMSSPTASMPSLDKGFMNNQPLETEMAK